MSRKSLESRTESNLTEAAERAGMLIRGLEHRLADRGADESTESLEWELQKCFAAEAGPEISSRFPVNRLRQKVAEGVAEKILEGWERSQDGKTAPLENEIIEALIERVFERLLAARALSGEVNGKVLNGKNSVKLPPNQLPA